MLLSVATMASASTSFWCQIEKSRRLFQILENRRVSGKTRITMNYNFDLPSLQQRESFTTPEKRCSVTILALHGPKLSQNSHNSAPYKRKINCLRLWCQFFDVTPTRLLRLKRRLCSVTDRQTNWMFTESKFVLLGVTFNQVIFGPHDILNET